MPAPVNAVVRDECFINSAASFNLFVKLFISENTV